ncbi:hypothetical protein MTP99_013837 [Tenebrio molitor]|nr:hypothetical protein MTP99_013837 [Tenebrio molitor]
MATEATTFRKDVTGLIFARTNAPKTVAAHLRPKSKYYFSHLLIVRAVVGRRTNEQIRSFQFGIKVAAMFTNPGLDKHTWKDLNHSLTGGCGALYWPIDR